MKHCGYIPSAAKKFTHAASYTLPLFRSCRRVVANHCLRVAHSLHSWQIDAKSRWATHSGGAANTLQARVRSVNVRSRTSSHSSGGNVCDNGKQIYKITRWQWPSCIELLQSRTSAKLCIEKEKTYSDDNTQFHSRKIAIFIVKLLFT